jgi:L-aminopeptidase/D-esterase-like protein
LADARWLDGLRVGHATDYVARTGCTVLLGPFRGACHIAGHATGTRELDPLSGLHVVPRIDALLLTGGSAFGLGAADGVVSWLEERGVGYDTGVARVPIVPAAVIFDLGVGRSDRRPDPAMGRAACEAPILTSVDPLSRILLIFFLSRRVRWLSEALRATGSL